MGTHLKTDNLFLGAVNLAAEAGEGGRRFLYVFRREEGAQASGSEAIAHSDAPLGPSPAWPPAGGSASLSRGGCREPGRPSSLSPPPPPGSAGFLRPQVEGAARPVPKELRGCGSSERAARVLLKLPGEGRAASDLAVTETFTRHTLPEEQSREVTGLGWGVRRSEGS